MVSNIRWWVVWASRVSGSLSVLSSVIIISHIIAIFESSRKKPNFRLLFVLSIVDVIQSLAYKTSSTPMPSGSYYGAIGNDLSCTIQGYFIHLGFAVPCYNASLCLFYYLTICHNYDSAVFIRKIEPFCHGLALGYPFLSGTICASLGLFNGNGSSNFCWLYDVDDPVRSYVISFIAAGVPVLVSFIIILHTMISINIFVLKRNRASRRFSFTGHESSAMIAMKQNAITQAILFSLAFCLTYVWSSTSIILAVTGVIDKAADLTSLAQSIFLPLQGFWNFIIFVRPIVKKLRSQRPELSLLDTLKIIVCDPKETLVRLTRRSSITERHLNSIRRLNINTGMERQKDHPSNSPLSPFGQCLAATEIVAAAIKEEEGSESLDESSSSNSKEQVVDNKGKEQHTKIALLLNDRIMDTSKNAANIVI